MNESRNTVKRRTMVLLDIKQAFDRANSAVIVDAMANKGIKGRLLGWVAAFLTGRTGKVRCKDHLTTAFKIELGF